MSGYLPIILSVPTSGAGATPAATFVYFTSGYKPPRQDRASSRDEIKNQNGLFIYPYDNGPGPKRWQPFELMLVKETTPGYLPPVAEQYANLQFLWNYIGNIQLSAPEGIYQVNWTAAPLEPDLLIYPEDEDDENDYRVVVNFEEGG